MVRRLGWTAAHGDWSFGMRSDDGDTEKKTNKKKPLGGTISGDKGALLDVGRAL